MLYINNLTGSWQNTLILINRHLPYNQMKIKSLLKLKDALQELGKFYEMKKMPSNGELKEIYETLSEKWYKSSCIELRADIIRETEILAEWNENKTPKQDFIAFMHNMGNLLDKLEEAKPKHTEIKRYQRRVYSDIEKVVVNYREMN